MCPRILSAWLLSVLMARAQFPEIAGPWVTHGFQLGLYEVGDTTAFDQTSLASDAFTIAADNTAMIDGESFQFAFDDGFVVAIDATEGGKVGLSEEIDTIIRSDVENTALDTSFFRRFQFEVGIRRPAGLFTVNTLAGRWISLQQTLITVQSSQLPEEVFYGAYQVVDQVDLNADGTFTLANLSATSSRSVGPSLSGTWQPAGTGLTLRVGSESLTLGEVSAGGDTALRLETEVFDSGGSQTRDRSFTLLLRETPTLSANDVIGSWAYSLQNVDTFGDPENFSQEFFGMQVEFGCVEFLANGQARVAVFRSSDPDFSSPVTTWSIEGNQLRIEQEDEPPLRLRVSAGLDFAAGLSFSDENFNENGNQQDYGLLTLCKLPETGSLFPARPAISAEGTVEVCSGSQAGVFYQLERSADLTSWETVGSPVEGTGAEICGQDPDRQPGQAYYRWRVVPAP